MTIYEVFGVLLVLAMMSLVFVATRFVASANYRHQNIWQITLRAYVWRQDDFREWLSLNRVYLWSSLLVVCLVISILGLIGSFSHNKIFDRPELVIIISPFLWLSIVMMFRWFARRLRE